MSFDLEWGSVDNSASYHGAGNAYPAAEILANDSSKVMQSKYTAKNIRDDANILICNECYSVSHTYKTADC